MLEFVFLLAMDWMMARTTADERRVRWNFTTAQEELDCVDDTEEMSFKFDDLNEKTWEIDGGSSQSRP